MADNDEKFSGNELEADEAQERVPIEEGENLKATENRGVERESEPVKERENSKGPKDAGKKKKNKPLKNGENLKNSGNEGEEKESEPIEEGKDLKSNETTHRGRKRLIVLVVLGMCLLSGTGYLFLKVGKPLIQREKTRLVERYDIPKNHNITFHSFIIPFKENDNFTYISLSIILNVPNKEVKRQIMRDKDRLRGRLYDILKEEINRFKEVPSMEDLKEPIKRGIDEALANEKVNEVFIDQFLAG